VLGNFSEERMPYERKDLMNGHGDIFYFLDEISFKPLDNTTTCDGYQQNKDLLYAQNYRHTDFVVIKKDTPVVALKPVFITDTLNIPAVFFEVNSSVIKPSYKISLDSLVLKIAGLKLIKMDIFGHTDHTGDLGKNLLLSKNRAAAVKQYFISALPQLEGKIFSDGFGASQPIASNASPQGRQQNRRVTVIVTSLENK
jgi:outer membrane protein OmpA-like peptidoglycan-associated protein